MKHLSEERIQALAFEDPGAPALSGAEESHLKDCRTCAGLKNSYETSRAALLPLARIQGAAQRSGLALRALAAAREEQERGSWAESILRAARFQVPALAAAVLLAVGLPRMPGLLEQPQDPTGQEIAGLFGEDERPPWPGAKESEEAWADWVLLAEETTP